jgi:hypothetical protein
MWGTIRENLHYGSLTLKNGVRNVCVFFFAVWHFEPGDYTGLLALMEIATRIMRDHHERSRRFVGVESVIRQLTVTTELCKRLREDNYIENAERSFGDYFSLASVQRKLLWQHEETMKKQDAEYLGKMLRFVRSWWN